jgi:formylglycine-generating enzyme required for sulfatase activity
MTGSTILVADDSRTIRVQVRQILTTAGFDVVEAGTGQEALEQIEEQHPSLAIVDITMPDVDGYELCQTGCELAATDEAAAATESSREIAAYYLDRFVVSNADYARFINDGGYSQVELWPQEIWPNVLQFVDSTGHTGPRFWIDGKPSKHQDDHPVVGVSWYEANAYARWVGKRLPVAAEWQHASSWCTAKDGRAGNGRYPWSDSFDPSRYNTWFRGPGENGDDRPW